MKIEIPRTVGLSAANAVAQALLADGCCARAFPAGSLRREKATVGDVEVVAELSSEFGAVSRVGPVLSRLGIRHGLPDKAGKRAPWGPRYFRAAIPANGNALTLPLDLFLVFPPATWAVVFTIRTGSAAFSQALVTRLHHYGLRSEDGRLVDGTGRPVATDTEEALFELCHLPFLAPPERDLSIDRTRALFARP